MKASKAPTTVNAGQAAKAVEKALAIEPSGKQGAECIQPGLVVKTSGESAFDSRQISLESTACGSAVDSRQNSLGDRPNLRGQLEKTRLCKFNLEGNCRDGPNCVFAHSLVELQRTPNLRKTQLCKAYAAGGCTDDTCTFAHGKDELCSTNIFFKKRLCIWFEKGKCKNMAKCRFAHGHKELRTRPEALEAKMLEISKPQPGPAAQKKIQPPLLPKEKVVERAPIPKFVDSVPIKMYGDGAPTAKFADIAPTASYADRGAFPQCVESTGGTPCPRREPNFNFGPGSTGSMDAPMKVGSAEQLQSTMQMLAAMQSTMQSTNSKEDLNGQLSQLYKDMAILNAQVSNVRRRMQLEEEYNSIQSLVEQSHTAKVGMQHFQPAPSSQSACMPPPGLMAMPQGYPATGLK